MIPLFILLTTVAISLGVTGLFDVRPVLLWTDALIMLLLLVLVFFIVQVRASAERRATWRQVLRSRIGMATAVILSCYVLVAALDSVHFRPAAQDAAGTAQRSGFYSMEVISVLDLLIMPLHDQMEKSYSAPFATRLYSKEVVVMADGSQQRLYPRLQYGGAHLADHEERRGTDIAWRVAQGAVAGTVLAVLLCGAGVLLVARRAGILPGQLSGVLCGRGGHLPWHVMMLTLSVIIVLIAVAFMLASGYHIFGTDKVGQDVFYQSLKSIRTALAIGTLTTLIMLPFALALGLMAGYFRGWIDDVIQYLYTTLNSIPGVLLIAAAVLMLQVFMAGHPEMFETDAARADMRLLFLCMILGITSWTGLCRLLRGETLKVREFDYVQAATSFGVGHLQIITRHVMPNVMHIVLISVVLDFSGLVLAEAILSYVGVGVDPSMFSWGNMINGARLELAREPVVWWSLLAAFSFMFVLVLAANLFSDVIRDAFDPKMRG
ncbi:MAG: ABC transporter permease [Gammaproteobacteria bacterium]|nr:ABC transporter permease [Gammaproteobacteria bacterium]